MKPLLLLLATILLTTPGRPQEPNSLMAPWRNDTHRDINEMSVQKTEITWWQEMEGPVKLLVSQGLRQIWQKEVAGTKGFNQIRWDGVVKESDVQEAYFFQYKTYINPGNYTVKLTGKGFSEEQDLTVLKANKYE